MQAEIMSIENAEKLADYPKQVEKAKKIQEEYNFGSYLAMKDDKK